MNEYSLITENVEMFVSFALNLDLILIKVS